MSIDFESLFGEKSSPTSQDAGRPYRIWLVLLLLLILLGGARLAVDFAVDWLWFESLGQGSVFRTRLLAPLGIFAAVVLPGAAWLALNWLWAARRLASEAAFPGQQVAPVAQRSARQMVVLVALALASVIALGAAGAWQQILLYSARTGFDQREPILGRDVGFYVFELPVWQLGHSLVSTFALAALLGAAIIYLLGGAIEAGGSLRRELGKGGDRRFRVLAEPPAALKIAGRHLLLLSALYALTFAAGAWLARFGLLTSGRADSSFYGPGFTDVTARMPAYAAIAGLWLLASLLLALAAFVGRAWPAIAVVLTVVALRFLAGELYPSVVQQYQVKPNELARERGYIEHNIGMTRRAWGLDAISTVEYEPEPAVSADLLEAHAATLDNVRLWDWQVLLDYFEQKQAIRPYYEFRDVDIDRYETLEGPRQVELSARELQPAGLRNPTWISRHLEYTHGYGLSLVPVDEVDRRGQPVLWARDLPVQTTPPFDREITQPRIYFGEGEGVPYVIVNTRTDEFDYPVGDDNARTTYEGAAGVSIGSALRRLAFAMRFGDVEILLADDVKPESRILLHRQITERVQRLAPFLVYDADPYLVITEEGRLVWILDAYTASDRYPYSQPVRLPSDSGGGVASYMRNSVKIVVDAYDGQPHFYVVDNEDPIVAAWQQVFPGLFEAGESMPQGLVAHWRYPETLFRAQSRIFLRYHVTRPDVFYNGEDLWSVPMETRAQGDSREMEPYYVTMRLRDETEPEFLLMLPFAPGGKKNMIAWLAARSDPGHYGELVLYNFGKGRQVDGPEQIESRIDNNTEISGQLTLWSQAGSRTIRGNLLVIPVGDALLYVEPLYLQAESNALPELKRVIVADGERVEMRETLEEALAVLVENRFDLAEPAPVPPEPSDDEDPAPDPVARTARDAELDLLPEDVGELVRLARDLEASAAAALQAGDWLGFGRDMNRLSRALEQLELVTGGEPGEAQSESGDGAASEAAGDGG